MPPRVSILVPAFNEERSVEAVLRQVTRVPADKEIVVIDDGSTDSTGTVLARLRAELPLRVVTHPTNLGKGKAIQTGLSHSHGEIILIQDADLECDPKHCPALLEPILAGRAGVVYGSRFLRPHRASAVVHRVANWIITQLINVLFGASLTDAETGHKVFRREIAESMSLRARSFEFEVEFTCKVLRLGHRIVELPVDYAHRRSYAEGKKITWKDGVYALWVIACCRFNPRY